MDASRQAWLAEQHAADASCDDLGLLPRVSLPHGGILALALPEEITEEDVKQALGSDYEVISITHAPDTHDRFVLARRILKKAATKKA